MIVWCDPHPEYPSICVSAVTVSEEEDEEEEEKICENACSCGVWVYKAFLVGIGLVKLVVCFVSLVSCSR